jgi:hypothetical protein
LAAAEAVRTSASTSAVPASAAVRMDIAPPCGADSSRANTERRARSDCRGRQAPLRAAWRAARETGAASGSRLGCVCQLSAERRDRDVERHPRTPPPIKSSPDSHEALQEPHPPQGQLGSWRSSWSSRRIPPVLRSGDSRQSAFTRRPC